jgi:hypothetical protein
MKRRVENTFDINQQRGFWLRCFLGAAPALRYILMSAAMVSVVTVPALAQIATPAPYHLAHLRGVFVDAKGNPIEDAAVTLDRDDRTLDSTRTDRTGKFEIKHASGRYWLRINKKGYAPVDREVIVGVEAMTYLHGETLYIIAGPGACSDDCSAVFTSKGKFEQAIRRNTGHHD